MAELRGDGGAFSIDVIGRFIPEGYNSWRDNWLEVQITLKNAESAVVFATRRFSVHDLYSLYFQLGMIVASLIDKCAFIPILEEQMRFSATSVGESYLITVSGEGLEKMDVCVTETNLHSFLLELREMLDYYPLREDEIPMVIPLVEFYATNATLDKITPPVGWNALLGRVLMMKNPLGGGKGDAMRLSFALSTPSSNLSKGDVATFFTERAYVVNWQGDTLVGTRGLRQNQLWSMNNKLLFTEMSLRYSETHSLLIIDVWTAGVKQTVRSLFAWVGEAAMLELFITRARSLRA
ncbi:MAG: hypothetical protein Q8N36_05015, partial [bacterium]|nr:hypothetical protein [bacterium]